MSGWMADMADLVDAAEAAAPAPPLTKAPSPESMRTARLMIHDGTSDLSKDDGSSSRRDGRQQLQLPTYRSRWRGWPEQFPTRWILNDGRWTAEEHEAFWHRPCRKWQSFLEDVDRP